MIDTRSFLLSFCSVFLFLSASCSGVSSSGHKQIWQVTYLDKMSPKELHITANILYLLYANSLIEVKVRQLSTPIFRLNQSIRSNINNYKNVNNEIATVQVLLDRLSYILRARSIYAKMLDVCMRYYDNHKIENVDLALESLQLHAQSILRDWADENAHTTAELLKKSSVSIADSTQYLLGASNLHRGMSEGALPYQQTCAEGEVDKPLVVLDILLRNNPELCRVVEGITNTLNEISDHAAKVIVTGAHIYKSYYEMLYEMMAASTYDKQYATTLFDIHDILSEERRTELPHSDHVFEHVLQITKLYTDIEKS